MGSNQLSNPPGVFVHGDTTVPRQTRSRTSSAAPPADSRLLTFVSRADQLQLRGQRNYDRYMRVIKNYVSFDGPERAQWQKESAEDAVWDAEWNKRHGPLPARGTKRHPSARRGVSAGRRRRFALCLRHYTGSFSAFRSRADIERDLVSGPRFVIPITIPVCTQITNTIETSSTAGY